MRKLFLRISKPEVPNPYKPLAPRKEFITIFRFKGRLFFHNDVFELQEVFSELEIRVFPKNGLGSFEALLNFNLQI
jgi:hypothetical protein